MGLFPSANDFKAGKGVEKDAPRKTGIGRFFELVGRDMNGMFLANLLTCIGFAPVICLVYIGFLQNSLPVMLGSAAVGGLLAGPALAGMYDTVLRALRDEAGYWWVTYRKAFKRNFKASLAPGVLYTVVVTLQIFLVYFCFNMLYHGTNVGVPLWVATVLNLVLFQMLFAYMWPQVVLLDQPLSLTLKNSINCMIAFLPHALAAAIVQVLFWGVVILCMPLGLFLMLIFGFWFVTEVSCQIVYGDIDRVFHIEENIRKMKDAELEAALKEDYADDRDLFPRAAGQPCTGKRRTGAGQRGRAQPFVRQLHHPGVRHAGLLQPERQLERPCTPGHHGGGALPGVRSRGVDKLDELWQVGAGLPPVQRVQPERGRHDLFDGRYRHGGRPGRRHRRAIAGEPFHQQR